MSPLITDLQHIAAVVQDKRDEYSAFGHYIDIMWDREQRADQELDRLVEAVAAEVVPQIDCTACANCCRTAAIGLAPADIPPLAQALHQTPERVITRYVDQQAGYEWGVFRQIPCPLLRGRLCGVYSHRPQSCRDYPAFTPDFRWLYTDIVRGIHACPIIFNVIERLMIRLGW